MLFRICSSLILILFLFSCSKKDEFIYEPSSRNDPYKLYKEAFKAFESNDFFYASKKFSEAELNFDKPRLAANLQLCLVFLFMELIFIKRQSKN